VGSHIIIDRRHVRAQQIAALFSSIISRHVPELPNDRMRDLMREIQDQLWADGAHFITEGDRIGAGLPPRNIYGLTVDELRAIEARFLAEMLRPMQPVWLGMDFGKEPGGA